MNHFFEKIKDCISLVAGITIALNLETKEENVAAINTSLISHCEHGANVSTFAYRVVMSSESTLNASLLAAVGAFEGKAHGGALKDVMDLIAEVTDLEDFQKKILQLKSKNTKIPGFGHRVYKVFDPRSDIFKNLAGQISNRKGIFLPLRAANLMENVMKDQIKHGLVVNVDLYSGVTYLLLGLTPEQGLLVAILGRLTGWIAHGIEQSNDNIIMRPQFKYIGSNLKKELK
jgi:citrate synthase